jgi:hypothetical protein
MVECFAVRQIFRGRCHTGLVVGIEFHSVHGGRLSNAQHVVVVGLIYQSGSVLDGIKITYVFSPARSWSD